MYPEPPSEITTLDIVPRPETTAVAAAPVIVVGSTIRTFCFASTISSVSSNNGEAISVKNSVEADETLLIM